MAQAKLTVGTDPIFDLAVVYDYAHFPRRAADYNELAPPY